MKRLVGLLLALVMLTGTFQGCSQLPEDRVDASDVMTAAKSLMTVLEGVSWSIVQGQLNLDQAKAIIPEMFDAGVITNKWLFQSLMDATNGKPIPKEAMETIMMIAHRFDGMTAQDIINLASGDKGNVSGRVEGLLGDLGSEIQGIINKR